MVAFSQRSKLMLLAAGMSLASGIYAEDNAGDKTAAKAAAKAAEVTIPIPPKSAASKSVWFVGVRAAFVPAIMGEIGYQFNNTFKLRILGGGFTHYFRSFELDGEKYDHLRFTVLKIGMMADWHLFKGGLRVTGGLAYNGNRVRGTHTQMTPINGVPPIVIGTVDVHYKFRSYAPYLGIGYDTGTLGTTGFSFSADAGFWFQGKARVYRLSITGLGNGNPQVLSGVKSYAEELLNKHKLVRFLPMISIGLRYEF